MGTEPEPTFKPTGDPIPIDQLTEYTEDGGVVIRRSDVEKAIATAEEELKAFLQAGQQKKK
jgi:hypothetical protein